MSTDLYGIRVLEVASPERRIRLRVFVTYYDVHYHNSEDLPNDDDPSFFVRIIGERGLVPNSGELSDDVYAIRLGDRLIERIDQLEVRNFPVEDWSDEHWSKISDFHFERAGGWEHEELLAQADYDVFVRDSEVLHGLSPGLSWGTTAYAVRSSDAFREAAELESSEPAPDDEA